MKLNLKLRNLVAALVVFGAAQAFAQETTTPTNTPNDRLVIADHVCYLNKTIYPEQVEYVCMDEVSTDFYFLGQLETEIQLKN